MHWPPPPPAIVQTLVSWMQTVAPTIVGSFGMGTGKEKLNEPGPTQTAGTAAKIVGPTNARHGAMDGPQNPPAPNGPEIETGEGRQVPMRRNGVVVGQGTLAETANAAFPTL